MNKFHVFCRLIKFRNVFRLFGCITRSFVSYSSYTISNSFIILQAFLLLFIYFISFTCQQFDNFTFFPLASPITSFINWIFFTFCGKLSCECSPSLTIFPYIKCKNPLHDLFLHLNEFFFIKRHNYIFFLCICYFPFLFLILISPYGLNAN